MSSQYLHEHIEPLERSRIHWGPIIAGVLLTLAIQVSLIILGLAIGLTALNPIQGSSFSGFSLGTGIWFMVATILSLFIGAMAATWLGNIHHRADSILHGIITWGLYMLLSLFVLGSSASNMMGGALSVLNTSIGSTLQNPNIVTSSANRPTAMQPASTEQLLKAIAHQGPSSSFLANLRMSDANKLQVLQKITSGDSAGAATFLSSSAGISQMRATEIVQGIRHETDLSARQAAQKVTEAAGRAAWLSFTILLISLAAAIGGGISGAKLNAMYAGKTTYEHN